jgi:acyl-CoA synthetase (AMP-forming)/AMP-acid ligase II
MASGRPNFSHPIFCDSVTESDVLAGHGAIRPHHIAMICGDRRISYGALDERATRIANGIQRMNLTPVSRIAVIAKNCAEYFEIFYGIVRAGHVVLPINWRLASPEIAYIIEDAKAECIFYDPAFIGVVNDLSETSLIKYRIPIDESAEGYVAWRDRNVRDPVRIAVKSDDVMIQFYTSGTTGNPKGVEISHRSSIAMRNMEIAFDEAWQRWDSRDVAIVALPNFHLSGTSWAVQWLSRGSTIVIQPQINPTAFLEAIQEHGVTQMMSIPTVITMMLDSSILSEIDVSSLRNIFYGGMPMPAPLLRRAMAALRCNFIQIYGMTENNGTICYLRPDDHVRDDYRLLKSCGRPLPTISMRILDDAGNELPLGEVGEVCIRSPSLMNGYWNLAPKFAEAMSGEYFRTGDAGYLDKDGFLFLVDRLKDMIVSGGENIYPAEIERVLLEHPQVAEISVVGVPDPYWGEAVLAVIVPRERGLIADELINFARGKIAGYKVPKLIEFADALPRNANGKILKRDLRERYANIRKPA